MTLFLISIAVTVFLLTVVTFFYLTRNAPVEERLMAVAARPHDSSAASLAKDPAVGLAAWITSLSSAVKPLSHLIMPNDEDMIYRLVQAGFRKPQHLEIYTASKMFLPVLAVLASTFAGDNWMAIALAGGIGGFLGPDFLVTHLTTKRKEAIMRALPDALDLLVICMEAGLGVDQALVRVGEDVRLTCPPLAEEFVIINREQRAGKQRLEAWRSMAERVDIDFVRQFVTMLVQTERFGTPIAHALGSFADSMRTRRIQLVEEQAAKSGVKLLFPLVLFIFPSIFVVLLGPAILNIAKGLSDFLQ